MIRPDDPFFGSESHRLLHRKSLNKNEGIVGSDGVLQDA